MTDHDPVNHPSVLSQDEALEALRVKLASPATDVEPANVLPGPCLHN